MLCRSACGAIPTAAQLAAIRGAPDGYLFKWSFRVFDDSGETSLYNDSTLVALPTGVLWKGVALLVSPVHEKHCGVSRILFSENGTRRVDIVGHRLKGQVVVEERCSAIPADELLKCPRGTEMVSLDGTDPKAFRGWTAEVLRGAVSSLPSDVREWLDPQFPRAWLAVNAASRCEGKMRRGHSSESIPTDFDFCCVSGRECLDFGDWHGKGVVAFEHATVPGWSWAQSDGDLVLESERGEAALALGGAL